VGKTLLEFNLCIHMLIYRPWPVFLPITMTVTHKLIKIVSGQAICTKCYCDLDLWPKNVKGSSADHEQSSYQVEWLSLINFLRYWADKLFALNTTLTLTFDLVTSKFIGVIYWPWLIFNPSTMTVTHKLFKILSGHAFGIKYYCDLWPSDLKIYMGHLLTTTNLPNK